MLYLHSNFLLNNLPCTNINDVDYKYATGWSQIQGDSK